MVLAAGRPAGAGRPRPYKFAEGFYTHPAPGRVLTESDMDSSLATTFTVTPRVGSGVTSMDLLSLPSGSATKPCAFNAQRMVAGERGCRWPLPRSTDHPVHRHSAG